MMNGMRSYAVLPLWVQVRRISLLPTTGVSLPHMPSC